MTDGSLQIARVLDISLDDVLNAEHDFTLVASGYESRCTQFAKWARSSGSLGDTHVLGFELEQDNTTRRKNDEWFDRRLHATKTIAPAEDDTIIYSLLKEHLHAPRVPRLCVDYTSMPRVWYAAVLNWLRAQSAYQEASVDFVYVPGRHSRNWPEIVVHDIVPIPSCEGSPRPSAKTVLLVGLGYDSIAPFAIVERLEPDITYAFVADPGSVTSAVKRVRAYNKDFLGTQVNFDARLPLDSVEMTLSALTEVAALHRHDANVAVVPLGPKPHVLASLLLAFRMREVECLRIQHSRVRPSDVRPTSRAVATRVILTRVG